MLCFTWIKTHASEPHEMRTLFADPPPFPQKWGSAIVSLSCEPCRMHSDGQWSVLGKETGNGQPCRD